MTSSCFTDQRGYEDPTRTALKRVYDGLRGRRLTPSEGRAYMDMVRDISVTIETCTIACTADYEVAKIKRTVTSTLKGLIRDLDRL